MATWSELSVGAKASAVAVVALLLGGGGYGLWLANQKTPVEVASDQTKVAATAEAPDPSAATAEGTTSSAEPAPAEEAPADAAAAPAKDASAEPSASAPAPDTAEPGDATPDVNTTAPAALDAPTVEGEAGVALDPAAADTAEATTAEGAAPSEADQTQTGADTTAQPETGAAETAQVPAAAPPSIDIARIEQDGTALVAGQAAPGAVISLMMNGVEVAAATADANGKFVALFSLTPGNGGQLMTLRETLPDGQVVNGVGQVAVAAIAAPVVVAEATEAPAEPAAAATAEAAPAASDALEPAAPDTAVPDAAAAVEAPAEPAPAETAPAETAVVEATPAEPAPQTTTTALSVTDEGVKVLQSGTEVPADVAANVSLDVIAYPSMSEVQFGGRGAAGSFVRLYLDNAPIGEPTKIATDGAWSATIPGIEPRIFTLRVDQLDASGKVTSRFETPFKRETPEALAAAAAAAPDATASDANATASTGTEVAEAAPQVAAGTESQSAAQTPAEPAIAEPAPPDSTAAIPPAPVTVTVQPGYTLWGIAKENFGEGVLYVQVFEANKDKIKDPDLIYPGQIFTIPEGN